MVEENIPQRGEIWTVDYSYNYNPEQLSESSFEIESEIKKPRPSLVITEGFKNFDDNISVIPLTSIELEQIGLAEVLIEVDSENGLTKDSKILVDLMKSIDKKTRLKRKIGKISKRKLQEVEEMMKMIYGLKCHSCQQKI